MINMMYLVLLALLTLNVDNRVLKAFRLMGKNFVSSANIYDLKNQNQMVGFAQMFTKETEKSKPYYEADQKAQIIPKEFNSYISKVKVEVENLYDGRLEEEEGKDGLTSLKMPEGMEKHAHYFMLDKNGKKVKELQAKINSTRD